jgi:hypothetical protein
MTEVLPAGPQSRAPWWLVLVAVTHTALGVVKGSEDGDDSLLWLAVPFVALTLVAAGLVALGARWAGTLAVVLTCFALAFAVLLVGAYLVGLFHLPQALVAVLITHRSTA